MRRILLVIGIVILAMLVAGCTQSSPAPAPTTTTSPGTPVTSFVPPRVTETSSYFEVPNVTPVVIPPTGVFVYVDYLGSFAGSYGAPVNMLPVQDSGERLFPVDALNGTVSASIAKLDGSSHTVTVIIYEDGKALKRGTSDSPYGMVNITSNL
jgi:hypothetical protein